MDVTPGNGNAETGQRAADSERTRRFFVRTAPFSMMRRLVLVAALLGSAAPAAAQTETGAPVPSDSAGRRSQFAIFGSSGAAVRDSLVKLARQQLGRRYVFGGTSPDKGFDCSGLIRYVLAKLDIKVPRTAAQQERVGATVAKDTSVLQPGDLVTFGRGSRADHIGIYVGDGHFIHASSAAGRVVESKLLRQPTRMIKPWRGARRVLAGADTSVAVAGAGTEG